MMAWIGIVAFVAWGFVVGFIVGRVSGRSVDPDHYPPWTRYSATCTCVTCRAVRDTMAHRPSYMDRVLR